MGDDGMITISFILQPDNLSHVVTFSKEATVLGVKDTLENDLRIPKSKLHLTSASGTVLDDANVLGSCGLQPANDGVITVDVRVVVGGREDYRMPDQFEVTVHSDDPDTPPKKILVHVERAMTRKPYLGGFRNKKSGTIYHHGSAQTTRRSKKWWEGRPDRFHRETQTHIRKSRSVQLSRECGTQMARPDLYIDKSKDKIIYPGEYFSSEQLAALKLEKTIVLQCYWRSYKARLAAKAKRGRIAARIKALEDAELQRKKEAESKHMREIERRMHPRTTEDFEILYNELENWRFHETKRIKEAGLDAGQRRKALAELLHKETKLLQTIDRLKITANKDNREKRINSMLELMAAPKKWELKSGEISEVHTPFTTRSKELMELYSGLKEKLGVDERLDVLLHVKWTVKEFDCNITRELVDLIDREADLLNRGRSARSLDGLRKRISHQFLQFIETPEFNPEAARFQRVPRDIMKEPDMRPIAPRPSDR